MLQNLITELESKLKAIQSLSEIEQLRVEFLGKQSSINLEAKKLGSMNEAQRRCFGAEINQVKEGIKTLIQDRSDQILYQELAKRLDDERLDLSIPPNVPSRGSIHPITQAIEEMEQIFARFGFSSEQGPDIETDWYNFTALNIAENHPARQMHDTFYLSSGNLLRTQTSPVQIRTMEKGEPPFRFISAGRTYRADSDQTHTPMFHQIEALAVDKNIRMSHLKYIIEQFIKDFFEQPNIEIRFRPSFFPFTEPSAEVDIRLKGELNWLEVMGCGMIHPNVLKNVDIDPEQYQGFALGAGIDRFAMLKYGAPDLRQFFGNDLRWLKAYSFGALDIPNIARGLTK